LNVKKLFKYKKLLNFYPPFIGAGIRLKNYNEKGTSYLVEMKLRWYNRNVYGTHFGGSLYAMCDPFFVFAAYAYFGEGYVLWDKSASIEFKRPGKGTVHALFEISDERLAKMKSEVDSSGKKTFYFTAEVKDLEENTIALVKKEIYIRKKS
jgi:hypothetical protein